MYRERLPDSFRERVWKVIFLSDTPAGRAFDITLLWLIGLSVTAVMLESVDSIREQYELPLHAIEYLFTLLFTIEYVVRIYVARRPLRYVFSFFGVVDLLSILPTYIGLFALQYQHFIIIRIFRILRMFRILKMARHVGEARILVNALQASGAKITVFLFGILTIVVMMGTMMYLIEGSQKGSDFKDIPTSIYWAIVTITTVGYGDITPQTAPGKIISAAMMILGYAIIAVPTGIVSAEIHRELNFGNRECAQCGSGGHLIGANYCRDCGEPLDLSEPG